MSALLVIMALVLDRTFGEPKRLHPLVGFGRLANRMEMLFRSFMLSSWSPAYQIAMGALALFVVVIPVVLCVSILCRIHPLIYFLINLLTLYFCLGYRSLKQHCWDVYKALEGQDLCRARKNVALIVSRDTQDMDESQVRKALIESALENGADAIFASIFWFLVGGAPLVVLHRLVNTLDAMWGYKTDTYLYFGRAAAKCDDALNFVPARLVALSYACVGDFRQGMRAWREQAHFWSSPNAGPVMTSGAGALNITLGGEVSYYGVLTERAKLGYGPAPKNTDVKKVLNLIDHAVLLWLAVIIAFQFFALWYFYA